MPAVVKIRDVVFGEGIPKICIPLADTNLEELKESVRAMENTPFDFIEWRADFYRNLEDSDVRFKTLTFLRDTFRNTPILFTIRTAGEGGMIKISAEDYICLNLAAINSGLVDLVDAELSQGDGAVRTLVAAAHQAGVKIIVSRHDSASTPSKDLIVTDLCRMQQLGADLAKFAVTPQSERDVLTLLDATLTMQEEHGETPVITMSMGQQGAVSRVCGSVFGSAVTFGTAGKASAPGQLPADLLMTFLNHMA